MVHREVIQNIFQIIDGYNLKVWFVWIPREGLLSYSFLLISLKIMSTIINQIVCKLLR